MNDHEISAAYQAMLAARRREDRSDCVSPDALLALVERTGPEPARLATLDHVMGCSHCLQEFELLRAVSAGVELDERPRRPGWWGPIAAAALVVLVVGGALWNNVAHRATPEIERGGSPSLIAIAPRGDAPRPAGALRFTWNSLATASGYELRIVTSDGRTVFAATTVDTVLALPDSVVVTSGRPYQWTVTAHLVDTTAVRSTTARFTVR